MHCKNELIKWRKRSRTREALARLDQIQNAGLGKHIEENLRIQTEMQVNLEEELK